MIEFAIVLVFISAILHVSWNVMLQSTGDPLVVATKALSLGTLLFAPFVVGYWIWAGYPAIPAEAWFYGLLTGIAELFYFMFLSYAYRHGELSIVYPIARGTAPVISVLLGLFLLSEPVGTYQVVGIILLILGVWMVRRAKTHGGKGIIPAFLTGVFIAAYTVIDKVGLNYTDPVIFGGLKYLFTTLCLLAWIPVRKAFNIHALTEDEVKNHKETPWWKIALVGIFIIATYQLVLFAMETTPVAIISPLRESASVIVTAWGIFKLNERKGLVSKIIGVVLIFAGIILLTLK
jgi:drug/metabolite transporter (DMT)-like permease